MKTLRAYFSRAYWKYGFSRTKALASLLSSFGALWLLVEISGFFSNRAAGEIKDVWWAFLLGGLVIAAYINRPVHEVACHLSGRDVQLRVWVGDFFSVPGAKIIGSNTTFDTDLANGLINSKSIQGQFTARNYSSVGHIDFDIQVALKDRVSTVVEGKPGKKEVFPVGTVAKLSPKEDIAYLVAIADLNANGVARASMDDLQTALPALWEYIANAGTIDALVIPVLGSGFSRIPQKREELVREILKSFIAACASSRFTDSLTVVIHPRDFYKNSVNLTELGAFLQHVCRYTERGSGSNNGRGAGTAIGG